MNQQWINDDFPRSFDASVLDETPYQEAIHFSHDLTVRARDGMYVKFHVADEEWIGKFSYGMPGYPLTSGLVSCPNPECAILLSAGTAYYINVVERTCTEIEVFPAVSVMSSREVAIICIVGCDRLACIDMHGVRWRSGAVVPDDLTIERIENDRIIMRGFDPMIQDVIRVSIHIGTGALIDQHR